MLILIHSQRFILLVGGLFRDFALSFLDELFPLFGLGPRRIKVDIQHLALLAVFFHQLSI